MQVHTRKSYWQVGLADPGGTHDKIAKIFAEVEANPAAIVNEWERKFLLDLYSVGRASAKQAAKIRQIYRRVVLGVVWSFSDFTEFCASIGVVLGGPVFIGSAVYFLSSNAGDLLYVGQSQCMLSRVGSHAAEGRIPFAATKTTHIALDASKLDDVESALIALLQPPWNICGRVNPASAEHLKSKLQSLLTP